MRIIPAPETVPFRELPSCSTDTARIAAQPKHTCPDCGEGFQRYRNMKEHRLTHSENAQHKCIMCGDLFPTRPLLNSHYKHHDKAWSEAGANQPDVRPEDSAARAETTGKYLGSGGRERNARFVSDTEASGRASRASQISSRSYSERRFRTKPVKRPNTCSLCGETFPLRLSLVLHGLTHSKNAKMKCAKCERTFESRTLLNAHCVTHDEANSTERESNANEAGLPDGSGL